jgi:hypothetical protein
VVAVRDQLVVVEPLAQQRGPGDVLEVRAALGVGVLPVAGELDLLEADARQELEDLAEAGRQVRGRRVTRDRVTLGEQDGPEPTVGDEPFPRERRGCERSEGRQRRRARRDACRSDELAPVELALVGHDSSLRVDCRVVAAIPSFVSC